MAEHQVNFDSYDVAVPWSTIPVTDTVDEGRYVLRIREIRLSGTKEGKLMAVGFFTIDEGPLHGVNFPIQNYVLGTDNDPLCNRDPNTWKQSFGGRQLNQLLEACHVRKEERSLRTTLARAGETRFQAYVTKSIQQGGDYAGIDQNRISRVAAYGADMRVPGQPPTGPGRAANGPQVPRTRMRPDDLRESYEHPSQDEPGGRPSYEHPAPADAHDILARGTEPRDDDIPF